jgi:hypothetical protein
MGIQKKRKPLCNARDRGSKFAPYQKMADFWKVFNDKSM